MKIIFNMFSLWFANHSWNNVYWLKILFEYLEYVCMYFCYGLQDNFKFRACKPYLRCHVIVQNMFQLFYYLHIHILAMVCKVFSDIFRLYSANHTWNKPSLLKSISHWTKIIFYMFHYGLQTILEITKTWWKTFYKYL